MFLAELSCSVDTLRHPSARPRIEAWAHLICIKLYLLDLWNQIWQFFKFFIHPETPPFENFFLNWKNFQIKQQTMSKLE